MSRADEDIPPNVVVLNGSVSCARNLPLLPSEELNGRAFFRVLHVEGGSKSTMFRCKTMIFSSELAPDIEAPSWSQDAFRFEMIIPDDDYGARELSGEILIAVYRSRWQGGNDFIGQASFDLSRLVSMDIGCPGEIEHNTVSGSFDLIDRGGRVAGDSAEIDATLEFSWRVPPSRPQTKTVALEPPASPGRSKSASRAKRPTSAGGTGAGGIRRIQSAQTAKKKAEQLRIELENKALQEKIKRSGTKAAKERFDEMYKKSEPGVSKEAVVGSKLKSTQGGSMAAKSPTELQDMLAMYKARSAAAEKENTTLRAQATKEKAFAKKLESDIARMKSQEISSMGYGAEESCIDALAIDREHITDIELKEMLGKRVVNFFALTASLLCSQEIHSCSTGEHDALQNSRRSLLRRLQNFKYSYSDLSSRLQEEQDRLRAAWINIDSAAGADDGVGDTLAKELRNIEAELLILEVDAANNMNSAARDEINEEKMIQSNLRIKLALAKENLEKAVFERDICQDRLNSLKDEGIIIHLKTVITTLRAAYYRCQRKARIDNLSRRAEVFDLEYMKHCPE